MSNVKEIEGTTFKNSSAILLARIVGEEGTPVDQASIDAIAYSIYQLDETDPDSLTAVTGHSGVSLAVANVIYDTLQQDEMWAIDDEGYNFRHILDVSSNQAFPIAGLQYQIQFTITPTTGQIIVVRFKLKAI